MSPRHRGRDEAAALAEHLPAALRLAAVLTGSGERAASLVASAMASGPRSPAAEDYPELRLRRLVVRRFLRRGRLRPAAKDPTPAVDGSPLLERFDALPATTRVALALRYAERLTTAEISTTLERPAGAVERALSEGVLVVGAEAEVAAALSRRAALAPAPETVAARTTQEQAGDRARRLRLGVVGVGAVLLLVLAVAAPSVLGPRLPVAARPAGHWGTVVGAARGSGWSVAARTVVATQELAVLDRDSGGERPDSCSVLVADGATLADYPGSRGPVRVNGHPGVLLGTAAAPEPRVAWTYSGSGAGGAVAEVDCTQLAGATDADVVAAAAKIRFKARPLRLPYALDGSPEHFGPGWVVTADDGSVETTYTSTEARWAFVTVTIGMDHGTGSVREAQTTKTTINGRTAYVSQDRDDTGLPQICLMAAQGRVCVKAYWTSGDWTTRYRMNDDIGAIITATAERLRLADDLDDPNTWFDAQSVLG